ncbi:MAG: hypothetical protein NWE88_02675 [Candidatus Bathyarchaeota archaeon]|nr:hypothetical protein [Candidatus Bathyarchaeota archaeon]
MSGSSLRHVRVHPRDFSINILDEFPILQCTGMQRHIAKLFVFSLYRLYKEQGEAFVPKLKSLHSSGSSKSPWELGKERGFDIRTEEFWGKGMRQAEKPL